MDPGKDFGAWLMPGTALYRHFDSSGALLYVGISARPLTRLAEHEDSHWINDVTRVEMERFSSREVAAEAERTAIKSENPIHNIVHNRSQKSTPRSRSRHLLTFKEVRSLCGINPVYSKSFPLPVNPDEVGNWRWTADEVRQWIEKRSETKKGRWKPKIEEGDTWVTLSEIRDLADYRVSSICRTLPPPSAKSINYSKGNAFVMKGRDLWRLSDVMAAVNKHRKIPLGASDLPLD
ncbi:hypothetical protein SHLA_4c002150 [Shinella sp. DD12]|nr:hypothetical protein SHLA_4c002150 [Shinella sp. DD12]